MNQFLTWPERRLLPNETARTVGGIVGLAILYFVAAKAGLAFAFFNQSVTTVWAPTGIAIAALILGGYRLAPGVFIGAFTANLITAGSTLTVLTIAGGNTLEALCAAYLVNTYAGGRFVFENINTYFRFTMVAVLVAPVASATVGTFALLTDGLLSSADYPRVWFTWWLGDALGSLVMVPLILSWANYPMAHFSRAKLIEFVTVLASASFLMGFVYSGLHHYAAPWSRIFVIVLIPLLTWLSIRFSLRETATAMPLLIGIAVIGVSRGYGPAVFEGMSISDALLQFQMFVLGFVSTFFLLTILVSVQSRIEYALRHANRAKDEFLATLAHELRNPLAPMVSYLDVLRLPHASAEEKEQALIGIKYGTERLSGLLDDLLDMARITAGKMKLEKRSIQLETVIEEAVTSVQPLIVKSQHTLTVEVHNAPLLLYADPTRIEQIIVNLLHNAIKYTDRGGRISIDVRRKGVYAVITVHDTGIGIEPAQLSEIFNMFTQVEHVYVRGRSSGGMGIGLRLVKVFTEMHAGTVEAYSEGLNKGSTFTVKLPLQAIIFKEESVMQRVINRHTTSLSRGRTIQ